MSAPDGIILNNWGNINHSRITYKGEVKSSHRRLKAFRSSKLGFRAMFMLLGAYIRKNFDTPEKIIYRYAPPSDNNPTESYINFVTKRTGIGRTQRINRNDKETMIKLVEAMARFETGQEPDMDKIRKGWEMTSLVAIVKQELAEHGKTVGISTGVFLILGGILLRKLFNS